MATLGYTTHGSSTDNTENVIKGLRVQASEAGTITSITAVIRCTTADKKTKLAVYNATSGGDATTKLCESEEKTIAGGTIDSEQTFTVAGSPALIAGNHYIICIWAEAAAGNLDIYYDTLTDAGINNPTTYGAWPPTMTGESLLSRRFSIWINYTAGGAVTISPNDIAIGLSLDATTLTQQNQISPADLSLALSLDAATLTQQNIISPADLAHALTLDATTLDQSSVVTPDDLAHALTLDSPALIQANVIQPDDLAVALGLDVATLTQQNIIQPNDILCSVALDEATVDASGVVYISPLDIGFALTLDQVALIQQNVIAPNDLFFVLSLDNATFAGEAGAMVGLSIVQFGMEAPLSLGLIELKIFGEQE